MRVELVVITLAAAGLLVACGPADEGAPVASASATSVYCPDPGPVLTVGSDSLDDDPTYATLTAGTYVARVSGFEHGGVLDPATGRTKVFLGPSTSAPVFEAGPYTITNASDSFDVVEGSQTVRSMTDGRIWLLNSNGAELTLQACGGATVSAVSKSP